jgi:hypothetical protein
MWQFYNGWELPSLPDDNAWEDFRDHEACRVAAITAATWVKDGWEVKRFTTKDVLVGFEFTGALADMQSDKMPLAYWNFWPMAYQKLSWGEGMWVSEIDVASFGFTPAEAFYHQCQAEGKGQLPGMVQTLEDYWDAGCMYVTRDAALAAMCIIDCYDDGTFPLPKCGKRILGWDALLREQARNCYNAKLGTYAYVNNTWRGRKVLHFPRTCLRPFLQSVS